MMLKSVSKGPAAAALALALLAPAAGSCAPAPSAPAAAPYAPSDWKKLDPANLLVIDTTKGRIVVELVPQVAPEHVAQIKTLVRQGYYDGLKFFRVIDEFMAQTGDKANTGAGESGVASLKGTFNFRRGPSDPIATARNVRGGEFGFVGPLPINTQPTELAGLTADGKVKAWGAFCSGVAGMARTSDPDSASAQFFLMRHDYQSLDDRYTPWGRVVAGIEAVRALNVGEPPANPDVMTKVRLASDLPPAEQPNVWRVDTTSAAFKAHMTAAAEAKGRDFTPCDVEVPSEIRK